MFDFEIRDNLILTKTSVIVVFQIEPIDIFLLNKEDQISFFARIYNVFNLLKGEIQINVLIRKSNIDDFKAHFRSLLRQNAVNPKRLQIVKDIISDLSELISDPQENILNRKFYFQIKEDVNTNNESQLVEAIKNLDIKTQRTTGSFIRAGIEVEQVIGKELTSYLQQFYL